MFWKNALSLYLSFQLDGFTLLKKTIESHLQLRKISLIQRLKKINIKTDISRLQQGISILNFNNDFCCCKAAMYDQL